MGGTGQPGLWPRQGISAIAGCRKRRVRIAPEAQAIFLRRRHQPRRPDRPQLSVALRMRRLRTIYRAENIGNVLKRVVNVCQREFVNEVLGPLVTEFVLQFWPRGRETDSARFPRRSSRPHVGGQTRQT